MIVSQFGVLKFNQAKNEVEFDLYLAPSIAESRELIEPNTLTSMSTLPYLQVHQYQILVLGGILIISLIAPIICCSGHSTGGATGGTIAETGGTGPLPLLPLPRLTPRPLPWLL